MRYHDTKWIREQVGGSVSTGTGLCTRLDYGGEAVPYGWLAYVNRVRTSEFHLIAPDIYSEHGLLHWRSRFAFIGKRIAKRESSRGLCDARLT